MLFVTREITDHNDSKLWTMHNKRSTIDEPDDTLSPINENCQE